MARLNSRSRRHRGAVLAFTAATVTLANGIALPFGTAASAAGGTRGSVGLAGASSVRKTINFGPAVRNVHHTQDGPVVQLYNERIRPATAVSASCAAADDVLSCAGKEAALKFAEARKGSYRLVDGYLSRHTGVYHAHFLQLHEADGIAIANANLNVNIDAATGRVLSFGYASPSAAQTSTSDDGFKSQVASWASSPLATAKQFVFGGSAPSSAVLQPAYTGAYSDPTRGLLTFLALQSPSTQFTNFLAGAGRQALLQSMVVDITSLERDGQVFISNVPSAVKDVKATLTYVNDGSSLRPAWKYELQTDDNAYEAYVDATAGVADGNEETLMAIDWVRDFRPTGGEVGFEATHVNAGALLPAREQAKKLARPYRVGIARLPNPDRKVGKVQWIKARSSDADRTQVIDLDESRNLAAVKPSYRVFKWGINAPDEGKRALLAGKLVDVDKESSPIGWHTIPFSKTKATFFKDTRGNNVFAQENWEGANNYEHNFRPVGGSNMTFDYPLGWNKTTVEPRSYINASVTELFYTVNEMHDLFYRYGFDELSGNFQEYNFDRGGLGSDAVQANAQDGSGTNNANFMTPPDGQRGRMRMYIWTGERPYRDGDFEAGIVIHEMAHGVSTRLTGGPANSGCLGWGEAGGAGEGWGDAFATFIRMHDVNETEFSMGEWASGRKGGIRNYKYSRNLTVNLDTYSVLDKPGYWGVHAIGEVWAEMLFEVAENLMDKHGFSATLFPPATNTTDTDFYQVHATTGKKVPKHGNTLALQLIMDGLKLQPCRPSFVEMRDAILQADKILTGGENACLISAGFSKRGLGPTASLIGGTPWGGGKHTEDFKLPKGCPKSK